MADPNVGEAVAAAYERKFGDKPTDNIFTSRSMFYALGKEGFQEAADGGRLIEFDLEYAENTNFHSYGEFEELDTSRVNVFDAARFDWKIAAGTIVYSELERLRNMGSAAKFEFVAAKIENGRNSHIADLNRQMWSDGTGNGSLDIGGIQLIISATPTTGSVGGINRANFSFWRNRQASGAQTSTAFDNLRSSWTSVFNQCSLGGTQMKPTDIATDRTVFEGYEQILVAIEQIQADTKKGNSDIAFPNEYLRFKSARVWYDEDAVASRAYMFSNKSLKLKYLKGGWMKMYPEVDPHNQLANVHKLATFCNMGTNASRHLGVVTAIT